jgi:hypothetical protein
MADSPSAPAPLDTPAKTSALVNFGGMLGFAACTIGIAIFLAGCAGYGVAFAFANIPMAMGAAGLFFTVVGGIFRHGGVEDTPILGGIFINLFALVGGLLLLALHQGWPIFPTGAK